MNTKALRQKILGLAIRGKLVPQNPNDEPASALLKKVRAQREREANGGGHGKKAREATQGGRLDVEDAPFELPEGWEWCRLGSIGTFVRGSGIKRSETAPTGVPCIRYGELYTTYSVSMTEAVSFVGEELADKSKVVRHGDLLLTLTGENKDEIAKTVAFMGNARTVIGGDLAIFTGHQQNPMYLSYMMNSPYALERKYMLGTGDLIVHISCEKLSSILIPLPPLAEQKRIAAAIEAAFAVIDEIERGKAELRAAVTAARAKVLSLAICGKLVPQNPKDEPASALLKKIRDQREIEANGGGRGKKAREAAQGVMLDVEDAPFELPEGWEWVVLKDVGMYTSGKTPKPQELASDGKYPYFKVADMNTIGNELYMDITPSYLGNDYTGVLFPENSIVFPKNGGAVLTNKKRVLRKPSLVDLNTGIYTPTTLIDFWYLFYFFTTIDFRNLFKGAILPTLDRSVVEQMPFPLPPLAEQKRIVAAIEAAFGELDAIEAAL